MSTQTHFTPTEACTLIAYEAVSLLNTVETEIPQCVQELRTAVETLSGIHDLGKDGETLLDWLDMEIAAAQAQNTMTAVVENAVTADLAARQVSYADFVTIQRDEGGGITALTTDMARMNLLRAELIASILEALEGVDVSEIQVPLGSLFDLEPLWAKGPAIRARAMIVGTVRAEFDSQLTSAGVNQTLHRIWMEVDVPMTLLLPGGEVEVSVDTRLCVAETVIVGKVPDTYLQMGQ